MAFHSRADTWTLLGFSESTLDRQIKAGALRVAKVGNRVIISDEAIVEFMAAAEADAA